MNVKLSGVLATALVGLVFLGAAPTPANDLRVPVPCSPCIGGSDGATRFNFTAPGSPTPLPGPGIDDLTGRRVDLLIDQKLKREVFNWSSFDIGADAEVYFKQRVLDANGNSTAQIDPTKTAINLIREGDVPSEILGVLRADGQVYLLNPNGVLFRPGAQVDLNTLVVSGIPFNANADPLADDIFAFGRDPDVGALFDATDGAGEVIVEDGARIIARENGRIVLIGRNVVNGGRLEASGPGGQVLLVGGEDEVYLITDQPVGSTAVEDTPVRGLDVAVNEGGTATNNGVIEVGPGNVTLAGRIVNQNGVVRATTAVNANGSVRLLARDNAVPDGPGEPDLTGAEFGEVNFGEDSLTEITLGDNGAQTATDAQGFPGAQVFANGRQIRVQSNAEITAVSGEIVLEAQGQPDVRQPTTEANPEDVFVDVAEGARIDASGIDRLKLPVTANLLELEVRGNELANVPAQRDGPLNGQVVRFDVRKPLPTVADLSAAVNNRSRTLTERSLPGGRIALVAERGAVNVASGATLDVSGGVIEYLPGVTSTTKVTYRGRIVDIHDADPRLPYTSVLDPLEFEHARWGITERFELFGSDFPLGTREPGYLEGKDAGSLVIEAAEINAGGRFLGGTVAGLYQRSAVPFDAIEIDPLTGALQRRFLETGQTRAITPVQLVGESRRRLGAEGDLVGFLRPHDELPAPGSLKLSSTLLDGEIRLEGLGERRIAGTAVSDGQTGRFVAEGFGDLAFETSAFSIDAGENIALGTEGSLRVVARDDIRIDGGVVSPGGDVVLVANPAIPDSALPPSFAPQFQDATGRVTVASGARIDLAGRFVFDDPATPGVPAPTPLAIDGGAFVVSNTGGGEPGDAAGVFVEGGALIDVGGGGHSNVEGTVRAGKGGLAVIENRTFRPVQFETPRADFGALAPVRTVVDGTFQGFTLTGPVVQRAEALSAFALTAPQIALGEASGEPGSVLLQDALIEDSGFHTVKLVSNESVLRLSDDLDLTLRPEQYQLPLASRGVLGLEEVAPVSRLEALATPGPVDPAYAAPSNLWLDSIQTAFTNDEERDPAPGSEGFPEPPNVTLELSRTGAIEVNPGGTIRIGNEGSLTVAGRLSARGGNVLLEASLPRDNEPTTSSAYGLNSRRYAYLPDFALRLAPGADIDVSGFVAEEQVPGDLSRIGRSRTRRFLGGGTVAVSSDAGYLIASETARIDLSGGEGAVLAADQGAFAFLSGAGERVPVATDAGRLQLTTGLGGAFFPSVDAEANTALGARGGVLAVSLDAALRPDTARVGSNPSYDAFTLPDAGSVATSGTGVPVEEIQIAVSAGAVPEAARSPAGTNLSELFNRLRVDVGGFVAAGGVDVSLAARSRPLASTLRDLDSASVVSSVPVANRILGEAGIAFAGTVDLAIPGTLVLDAPVLQSDGGTARVDAGFIRVGSSERDYVPTDVDFPAAVDPEIKTYAPVAGSGNLTLSADAAEFVGFTSLHGFGNGSTFAVSADTDLRFTGVRTTRGTASSVAGTASNSQTPEVQIAGLGDIVLAGERVYPTTLTEVGINRPIDGLATGTGVVAFTSPDIARELGVGGLDAADRARLLAGTPDRANGEAPLSVGGAMAASGREIFQTTSLYAPLGDLRFEADRRVALAPGSLTSVSAAGLSVPFGRTELGDYVIPFLDRSIADDSSRTTVVYRADPNPANTFERPFPSKSLQFAVAAGDGEIDLAAGARLDVRGGGEVFATEFSSGPRGTVDILEPSEAGGAFAVLPGVSLPVGVRDPLDSPGFAYAEPAYVTLDNTAVPGLPAGRYAILPPRFALLEGAYLLTPRAAAAGYVPDSAAVPFTDPAGVDVAYGQLSGPGEPGTSDFRQPFSIESRADVGDRAEYLLSDANTFFTRQARNEGVATPTLPRDAGGIVFDATAALNLGGAVTGDGGGGRGSRIDILADRIAIGTTPRPATLVLAPELLSTLGADSLLVGARRSVTGDLTRIDEVNASELIIDGDVVLDVEELLVAARNEVRIETGAALRASGQGQDRGLLDIAADAALVGLSDGTYRAVTRSVASDARAEVGGALAASGTLIADAGGGLEYDAAGTTFGTGASGFFGAGALVVGDGAPGESAVALGQVSSENGLSTLALRSDNPIIFREAPALTPATLLLDAPGVRRGAGLGDLSLSLSRLTLKNLSGTTEMPGVAPAGELAIRADRIELGATSSTDSAGAFLVDGFERVVLSAPRIEASADHRLELATGPAGTATFATDLLRTTGGAALNVETPGTLAARRLGNDSAAPMPTGADALAGSLAFSARAVDFATRVIAPSGRIALTARDGDLGLGAGAQLDAAGLSGIDFDGLSVGSAGGRVALISEQGDVVLGNGGGGAAPTVTIDVSGGSGTRASGSGGTLIVEARQGDLVVTDPGAVSLRGRSGADAAGAEARLAFAGLSGLGVGDLLTTMGQGTSTAAPSFTGSLDLAATGVPGGSGVDFTLTPGDAIRAHRIRLVAGDGPLTVGATLDARGDRAGRIELVGRDGVALTDSAALLASASGGLERMRGTRRQPGLFDAGYQGGTVEVAAPQGAVTMADGAEIDLAGTNALADGTLVSADTGTLRLVSARAGDAIDLSGIAAGLEGVGALELLGYTPYDAGDFDAALADVDVSATLSTALEAIADRTVAADLVISAAGDFTIDAGRVAALNALFDGAAAPGRVTLRAGGDLTLAGDLVDGRIDATNLAAAVDREVDDPSEIADTGRSWSIALVAGAEAGTVERTALAPVPATLRIDGDIGTGTGDIVLAASEDVVFGTDARVLSTGRHVDDPDTEALEYLGSFGGFDDGLTLASRLGGVSLPETGGRIDLRAGRRIEFPDSLENIQKLGYRDFLALTGADSDTEGAIGRRLDPFSDLPRSWGFVIENIPAGTVASLAGGDVSVASGQTVRGGSFVVSAAGRQVGEVGALATSRESGVFTEAILSDEVELLAPGSFTVRTGDLRDADLITAYGAGRVIAAGDVAGSGDAVSAPNPTRLFVGQAALSVEAAGTLEIGTIADPTTVDAGAPITDYLLDATPDAAASPVLRTFLSSGEVTGIQAIAGSGDLVFRTTAGAEAGVAFGDRTGTIAALGEAFDYFLPASFLAVSLAGDALIEETSLGIAPASGSDFLLGAGGDVRFTGGGISLAEVRQFEAIPENLITSRFGPRTPFEFVGIIRGSEVFRRSETGPVDPVPALGIAEVNLPSTPNHTGNFSPLRIVARAGDVERIGFDLAQSARVTAGRDVANVTLNARNVNALDVTSVKAGRDIRQSTLRNPVVRAGAINEDVNDAGFFVNGGGEFLLAAVGDIDLGTSLGARSLGGREDRRLEALDAASVTVIAGLGTSPAPATFLADFTDAEALRARLEATLGAGGGSQFDTAAALSELVETGTGAFVDPFNAELESFIAELETAGIIPASEAPAVERFAAVEPVRQLALASALAFDVTETGGREGQLVFANAAMNALFPQEGGTGGNLTTPLSTIQTQDGGDVNILVPYGSANTGLTALAGLSDDFRADRDLGIIAFQEGDAQAYVARDYEVNSTRLFAQSGGNVLVFARDGDIDAGRGAKSVADLAQPEPEYDRFGNFSDRQPLEVAGSGIRTFAGPGVTPGDVLLFAPQGTINAGDAGIGSAGGLVAVANDIIGGDNISAGGPTNITTANQAVSVDVGAADVGAAATRAATQAAEQAAERVAEASQEAQKPKPTLAKIDVDVLSFGE